MIYLLLIHLYGTCNPRIPISNNQIVIQSYLINGKAFKDKQVYFQSRDDLNNDVVFSIDAINTGLNPVKINYLGLFLVFTDGKNSLMSNLLRHKKSTVGTFLYCKGFMKIRYHSDKELKLTLQKVYPKKWADFDYYKDIIETARAQGLDAYDEILKKFEEQDKDSLNDFFE